MSVLTPSRVAIIVATDRAGAIGVQNRLPWKLPEDLKRFRTLTIGQPIIMGRKTYDSIGRPLPGRLNLVVSRQTGLTIPGVEVHEGLAHAINRARQESAERIWVIGGSEIYRQSLEMQSVDEIFLTEVDLTVEGADAFFPSEWNENGFSCVEETPWESSTQEGIRFRYRKLTRSPS